MNKVESSDIAPKPTRAERSDAAARRQRVRDEVLAELGDDVRKSFEKKLAEARKKSVSSPLGFVVPKLSGKEALYFMHLTGGFAISRR